MNIKEINKLTSIDCSYFLSWTAYHKFGVILNKTQMQKLLYLWYGFYLAKSDTKLFSDDTPKAWPFGPVFPRVNKRYSPNNIPETKDLPVYKISKNQQAFDIMLDVVTKYHDISAFELSKWSHEENGPWYKTIYGDKTNEQEVKWNKEIPDFLIKEYFTSING